ncbi:hypothetical protein [Amycolatopsis sp. FDAARGOS 1241]|uniref:hypothetical protein n=1 Tax=Amycolatopsis sp. FDAARGOS 1241 TaxID=2778070 RepID=UPI002714CE82|nr:hypothetical protein [Amycolatopsis sp. FDAARGOS 1241]
MSATMGRLRVLLRQQLVTTAERVCNQALERPRVHRLAPPRNRPVLARTPRKTRWETRHPSVGTSLGRTAATPASRACRVELNPPRSEPTATVVSSYS